MKLTFKDLKQQKFVLEAEPSETIAQIKEKISKEKGWEVAQQKLIYSGKILQDQNTVEFYKIEEKGFIVCMVSKPKPAPSTSASSGDASASANKSSSSSASAPAATSSAPSAISAAATARSLPSASEAAASTPATTAPAAVAAAAAPGSATHFNDPSALAMGAEREAAISNMMEMGYPRDEIDRAMRAAFYNPDRAVEYLLMGIPEHLQQEQRQPAPRAPPAAASGQPGTAAAPAAAAAVAAPAAGTEDPENVNLFEAAANAARQRQAGGGAGGNLGNLEFLRNNPQFQQLRQVVQQQPQMLEPILQQVSAGNPGLAALINQNQEAFLQLLGEGSDDGEDDGPLPPGTHQVVVTEEERQAIDRLIALGFERDMAIQAYFAFDKNEELAANFLFEQQANDDQL